MGVGKRTGSYWGHTPVSDAESYQRCRRWRGTDFISEFAGNVNTGLDV